MGPVDPASPATGSLHVEVVYAPDARQVERVALRLPSGATVADALEASGLPARHGWADLAALRCGVWMKPQAMDTVLRDRDRVEVYRPLKVDPKEARRQRYRSHKQGQAQPGGRGAA